MSIDVVGINSVANLIRQSGLTKFIIYREGSGKGSVPVFENIYCDSNAKAKDSFTDWANNILTSNPTNTTVYEILLFDERALLDEDTDEEEEEPVTRERPKRSKKKSNRIRFRFQLSTSNLPVVNGVQSQGLTVEDVKRLLDETIVKVERERQQNEILQRLKRLEEGDEDEDEEDEEEDVEREQDTLGRVEKLFDRVESWGKFGAKKSAEKSISEPEKKPEAVSGVEDISKKVGRDVKANINKAITKLYKYDKDLDLDLLKLAEMAEKDQAQFTMFVNALRKM